MSIDHGILESLSFYLLVLQYKRIKMNINIRFFFCDSTIQLITRIVELWFKGMFLEFQMCHKFANLFSKLSESTFYKKISVSVKSTELKVLDKQFCERFNSLTLLCIPVSPIFVFVPKIGNAAIVMLHCILG